MDRLQIFEVTKSTGGVGEYVRWLANGLDKTRFALTVACLSEESDAFAAELNQIEGVSAFSLDMDRYRMNPLSDSRVAAALARRFRQQPYDLIHAHASKPGFLARLAAAGTGIPVIYSPHCFSFHPGVSKVKAWVLALVEAFLARLNTTRFMTVADGEQTLARQYRVGRPEQFTTVHSGIDPRPFQQPVDRSAQRARLDLPDDALVVGSVGRLGEQKAPLDFVRAAGLVAQSIPQAHFLWVGSGPLLDQAVQLSGQLGLAGKMHFAGQRSDIPACLAAMDCFVLTSLWEGFPLVVLEAMAAGLPVVATAIPGSDEAIQPGKDGLLVPPANPQAMADAVVQVLSNPALREQLGAAGREKVHSRFNREAMIAGVSRLYIETTAKGRK